MIDAIARLIEPLFQFFFPSNGRHRMSPGQTPAPAENPTARVPPTPTNPLTLRGEDIGLVRPYLTAYERRQARKRRQAVLERAYYILGVPA